jgi:hypothetical protein
VSYHQHHAAAGLIPFYSERLRWPGKGHSWLLRLHKSSKVPHFKRLSLYFSPPPFSGSAKPMRSPGAPGHAENAGGAARFPGRGSHRLWVRNSLETPWRFSVFEEMQAHTFVDPGRLPLCSRLSCEIFRMYPGDALVSPFTPTSGWWSTSPNATRSAGVWFGAPTARSSWPD